MADSSGVELYRLEIGVKSATLAAEMEGNFYVRISLSNEEEMMRTRQVKCSKDYKLSWGGGGGETFGFSIPERFISHEGSWVCFTLFKARFILPDLAVGQVTCDVRTMFPVEECLNNEEGNKYNDPKWEYQEPEIQEKETFELRASVEEIPIVNPKDESTEIGTMKVWLGAWRKYFLYEVNLKGRPVKSYPIIKGSEKLGKFTIQRAQPSSQKKMQRHQPAADEPPPPKKSGLCFAS